MNRSTTQADLSVSAKPAERVAAPHFRASDADRGHQPVTKILCCYHNRTPKMQVVRSASAEKTQWYLERVVFPDQRLMFEAPQQGRLQIYNGSSVGNLLSDTVPCDRLQVSGD